MFISLDTRTEILTTKPKVKVKPNVKMKVKVIRASDTFQKREIRLTPV